MFITLLERRHTVSFISFISFISFWFLPSALAQNAQHSAAYVSVRAVLESQPSAEQGVLRLPQEGGTVGLYLDSSVGDVREYRIDLLPDRDTDGDGVPDNDADNRFHSSLRTGGTFPVNLVPSANETQKRIVLTVIGQDGSTSAAELQVLFDPSVTEAVAQGTDVSLQPRTSDTPLSSRVESELISDQEVITIGERFTVTVQNPPVGTVEYAWDLQGDRTFDTQTRRPSILLEPDAAGILPLRVTFLDAQGRTVGEAAETFTVEGTDGTEGTEGTEVRIDTLVEGLTAHFSIVFEEPVVLSELAPTWEFGDGQKSYLLEPQYTYSSAGSYDVSLVLHDVVTGDVRGRASASVSVTGTPSIVSIEERDGGFIASLFKPIFFVMRIALFTFLLLSIPLGVLFLFLFLKARRESEKRGALVTVREIIKEYQMQLRGERIEQPSDIVGAEDAKESDVIDVGHSSDIVEAITGEPGALADEEAPPVRLSDEPVISVTTEEAPTEPSPPPPPPEPPAATAPPPEPAEPEPQPQPEPPPQVEEAAPTEQTQSEELPSWLTGSDTQAPPPPPASEPPASAQADSGRPASADADSGKQLEPKPKPEPEDVPAWLDQGMQKAEEVGEAPPPIAKEPEAQHMPLVSPEETLNTEDAPTEPPLADDDIIATVKMEEMPRVEDEEKKEEDK